MTTVPGPPIATGRTAVIYEWIPGQVLKVFTDVLGTEAASLEVRNSEQAFELGITPIRCHGVVALEDGRIGVAFDRLHGAALTTVAERRPYLIPSVARRLAHVHAFIHSTTGQAFRDICDIAVNLLDTEAFAPLTVVERDDLRTHIHAMPSGNAVLHLDFHPLNVFEHGEGLATIDWQSTASGDPAADVAATIVLFTEAEPFPGISTLQRIVYQSVQRLMLRSYLAEYQRLTGIGPDRITPWMTTARVLRLGWLDVESERDALLKRICADTLRSAR
ncbi:aminoglycoside phosphotransferase family protein [Gordonia oryzae]|uniref:Aminoglycoside phosphotransferase family protein n=1 Tax=Gordonia oryzae TaxID=2487349 RepID=A0A3N4GAV3_9ACTN|nr:phosphotransferase [Gordonia oryzae]RPA58517.1 aminoglycoside phosphotransferase family protein [Gordonia oryzae]